MPEKPTPLKHSASYNPVSNSTSTAPNQAPPPPQQNTYTDSKNIYEYAYMYTVYIHSIHIHAVRIQQSRDGENRLSDPKTPKALRLRLAPGAAQQRGHPDHPV